MISIIVPVYKVEKYLAPCIESILAQTFRDFELILVDDGSPDNCGCICDEYAKRYSRIRVIHKSNGGLSDARNAGLDIAKGEYVAFIDSDDIVHPKLLEYLMDCVGSYNAEIAVCRPLIFEDGKSLCWEEPEYAETSAMDRYEAMENIFVPKPGWIVETAWGKIYKRGLFKEIHFPVGRQHEDNFTTYKLFYEAHNIVFIDRKLYGYRIRQGSITDQPFKLKRMDAFDAGREALEFVKKNCPELLAQVRFYFVTICLTLINEIVLSGYRGTDLMKKIKREIFIFGHPFKNSYITHKQKFLLVILRISSWLYRICYKILYLLYKKQLQRKYGELHE